MPIADHRRNGRSSVGQIVRRYRVIAQHNLAVLNQNLFFDVRSRGRGGLSSIGGLRESQISGGRLWAALLQLLSYIACLIRWVWIELTLKVVSFV